MNAGRLGILGGSFDPVHDGHVELARRARKQLRLDEVWLIAALQPPHKPDRVLASPEHRLAMLRLAIAGEQGLVASRFELDHPECRFSADTLEALRAEHPDVHWHFLMGEDSLIDLPDWHDPARLVRLAVPVVAPRPGAEGRRPGKAYGVPLVWLEGEPLDLSSTALREALARGERPEGMAPPVVDYALEHQLYRDPS